ncbi:hypothetical protein Hanom_Chr17g01528341 [Helianthus anomalus]
MFILLFFCFIHWVSMNSSLLGVVSLILMFKHFHLASNMCFCALGFCSSYKDRPLFINLKVLTHLLTINFAYNLCLFLMNHINFFG